MPPMRRQSVIAVACLYVLSTTCALRMVDEQTNMLVDKDDVIVAKVTSAVRADETPRDAPIETATKEHRASPTEENDSSDSMDNESRHPLSEQKHEGTEASEAEGDTVETDNASEANDGPSEQSTQETSPSENVDSRPVSEQVKAYYESEARQHDTYIMDENDANGNDFASVPDKDDDDDDNRIQSSPDENDKAAPTFTIKRDPRPVSEQVEAYYEYMAQHEKSSADEGSGGVAADDNNGDSETIEAQEVGGRASPSSKSSDDSSVESIQTVHDTSAESDIQSDDARRDTSRAEGESGVRSEPSSVEGEENPPEATNTSDNDAHIDDNDGLDIKEATSDEFDERRERTTSEDTTTEATVEDLSSENTTTATDSEPLEDKENDQDGDILTNKRNETETSEETGADESGSTSDNTTSESSTTETQHPDKSETTSGKLRHNAKVYNTVDDDVIDFDLLDEELVASSDDLQQEEASFRRTEDDLTDTHKNEAPDSKVAIGDDDDVTVSDIIEGETRASSSDGEEMETERVSSHDDVETVSEIIPSDYELKRAAQDDVADTSNETIQEEAVQIDATDQDQHVTNTAHEISSASDVPTNVDAREDEANVPPESPPSIDINCGDELRADETNESKDAWHADAEAESYDQVHSEESSSNADTVMNDNGSIKLPYQKSVNSEFVDGLDDIDKFFQNVDPPDELDVGAVGSSIQEVLVGQSVRIVLKRIKIGFQFCRKRLSKLKHKMDEVVSRRTTADGEVALITREEIKNAFDTIKSLSRRAIKGLHDLVDDLFENDESDEELFDMDNGLDQMRAKLDRLRREQVEQNTKRENRQARVW